MSDGRVGGVVDRGGVAREEEAVDAVVAGEIVGEVRDRRVGDELTSGSKKGTLGSPWGVHRGHFWGRRAWT